MNYEYAGMLGGAMTVDTWPILIDRLDGSDLVGWTGQFVADLSEGFDVIDDETHPWTRGLSERSWAGVLSIGMGGSAAAGDLLATMMGSSGSVPVISIRGYDLPNWFDPETWLVLCTSYSGNTEETLSACRTALAAGAVVVAISTGGELAGLAATEERAHLIPLRPGQPPRTAFGQICSRQLALMWSIGLLERPPRTEIDNMLHRLEEAFDLYALHLGDRGGAGGLAEEVGDAPIAVLATSDLAALGQRFVNQLAEHSGRFARLEIVPEQNHNMLVAWGAIGTDGDASAFEHAVLILEWEGAHARTRQRLRWFTQHPPSQRMWRLTCEGDSLLEAFLHGCILTDQIALACALLKGKDPESITPIRALKEHLSEIDA